MSKSVCKNTFAAMFDKTCAATKKVKSHVFYFEKKRKVPTHKHWLIHHFKKNIKVMFVEFCNTYSLYIQSRISILYFT